MPVYFAKFIFLNISLENKQNLKIFDKKRFKSFNNSISYT